MKRISPDEVRVTDFQRQEAADRLIRALGDGSLDVVEFDTRVAGAWAATTRGELTDLIGDLPSEAVTRAAEQALRSRRRTDRGYRALRRITLLWLVISGFSLMIWGLSCMGVEHLLYPWCIWVVGPAGGALSGLWFWLDGHAHPDGHNA
jgi:hypothetical protein